MQKISLNPSAKDEAKFKYLILGAPKAGKTVLLHAMAGESLSGYKPTVGINFKSLALTHCNTKVNLTFWDTTSDLRFKTLTTSYYRGADLILYAIYLADRDQLDMIPTELEEIKKYAKAKVPIFLVGNIPSAKNSRTITKQEISLICAQYKLPYIEVNFCDINDVSRLVSIGLDVLLSTSRSILINRNNGTLTFEQEIDNILAICEKKHKSLDEYLSWIAEINPIIKRHKYFPKHVASCYYAKSHLLKNIFSNNDYYKFPDKLVDLFFEYLDSLDRILHDQSLCTNQLKDIHAQVIIKSLNLMSNTPELVRAFTTRIDEFYHAHPKFTLPNDSLFQPLIVCKLKNWVCEQHVLNQLTVFRRLPYFGLVQDVVAQLIDELILVIRKEPSLKHSVTIAMQEYFTIQSHASKIHKSDLAKLWFDGMRILHYCLPSDAKDSELWGNLSYLELNIMLLSTERLALFMQGLVVPQALDERRNDYIQRIALSDFLRQSYSLDDYSQDVNDESNLSPNEIEQRELLNQIITEKSFERLIKLYSNLDNSGSYQIQCALDLLQRLRQLETYHRVATAQQMQLLTKAVNTILLCTKDFDDHDADELQQMSVLLSEFICKYWDVTKIVNQFQQILNYQNKAAQSLCTHILSLLMAEIAINEDSEHYLERLSATVTLFAIFDPMKQHYQARLILLVNAEQVVQNASVGQLTPQDFQTNYGNLALKPEQALIDFVESRQGCYFQALCRCYRLSVHHISIITLIKQYLIVRNEAIKIDNDNQNLIINILNEQISVKDTAALIETLTIECLSILAKHHFSYLSQFIRCEKVHVENVTSKICNTPIYQQSGLSRQSLENLAKSLFITEKYQELLTDLIAKPFKIFNHNIFTLVSNLIDISSLKVDNPTLMIDAIISILVNFFRSTDQLYLVLGEHSYEAHLTSLLQYIPRENNLYSTKYLPVINRVCYHFLSHVLASAYTNNMSPAHKQQCIDLVRVLIEHGANILSPQYLDKKQLDLSTNALLSLMLGKHHELLITILRLYHNKPEAIIDNTIKNNYFGHNPLYLVISNGGSRKLVKTMLKLGFSTQLIDSYLREQHQVDIIKKATIIKKNNEALQALYLFRLKKNIVSASDARKQAINHAGPSDFNY